MPRSYVVEVETNIKGGAHVVLGERTLIVGPPRSGKSTIVAAIEAAGSGAVSDVAGRALLAKDADLASLGSAPTLYAFVRFSDNRVSTWKLARGHRAERSGPEIAFPLRNVREALLGSVEKARRWILAQGDRIEWSEVAKMIPVPLQPRLQRILWDQTDSRETAERLAAAIDTVRGKVRELRALARAPLPMPAGPPPLDSDLHAAEAAVARLNAHADAARLEAVRVEVASRRARIVELENDAAAKKAAIDALPTSQPVSELARSALTVIEHLARAGARQCVICGEVIEPAALVKRANAARAAIDAQLKADEARQDAQDVLDRLKEAITRERAALVGPEAEEKRLAAEAKRIADIGDPEAARQRLSDLHARRAAYHAAMRAESEARQAAQEALRWEELGDALGYALGKLVDRARRQFERVVQSMLPQSYHFGVDLLDGEREVLRVGLRPTPSEDLPVRPALSGVEWATMTAALALATAPADGPVVVVPEDRAHNAASIAEVMRALRSVKTQIVITSPVGPDDPVRGWTIVHTGPEASPVSLPKMSVAAPPAEGADNDEPAVDLSYLLDGRSSK